MTNSTLPHDQKRHSRLSLSSHHRNTLTPPPTEVPSPRTSSQNVNTALNKAFASEEEQPTLFPPSFYRDRTPSRPRTPCRTSGSDSSRRLSSSSSSSRSLPSRRSESGSHGLSAGDAGRERSYSPMAAAFASLKIKDGAGAEGGGPPPQRGRANEAGMFGESA